MATNVDAFANAHHYHAAGKSALVAGNIREAFANYERALWLRPDFGEAYNDLGIVWHHLGEWARAEGCYRQAIRLMPTFAQAYNNLGSALREQEPALIPGGDVHQQGELDREVVGYYRQALRLKPRDAAISINLAVALAEQGLLDEAVAQIRQTLEFQPDHAMAYYLLSELAAEGRCQFAPAEVDRIKVIMTSSASSVSERSLCSFAMARVLNQEGRHDDAFDCFEQANILKKHLFEERNIAFDAQAHEAMIDRIIGTYDQAYFEGAQRWGTETEVPVFIIGIPRSGSTLVEQILASHSQVVGVGEIGEFHQFTAKSDTVTELYETQLPTDQRAAGKLAADYLQWLAKAAPGAARVTNKTLQNFLHLGLIATVFPRARIIHCRRDPLDTCLSCYFTNFLSVTFATSLDDIGAYYRSYDKLMAHWSRVLPVRIHEVCYEELVHDQEGVTRTLLGYCGLDWHESCLAFFKTRRIVRTASRHQVRKPISAQAIGRWKHYRHRLGPLFLALGSPVARATQTSANVAVTRGSSAAYGHEEYQTISHARVRQA
jgi:Tfp pilus assembly protein PilF